jgi:MFS family permease
MNWVRKKIEPLLLGGSRLATECVVERRVLRRSGGGHMPTQPAAGPHAEAAAAEAPPPPDALLVPAPAPARAPRGASCVPWAIVGLAFAADALCLGSRSFFAVVLELWEKEFGWSRAYVSSAMSLVHVCNGASTPLAGHIVDVLGARGGLTAGILYLSLFLGLTAAIQHSWQLWLVFGVGLGTGFGLLNLNVFSAIVLRALPKGRTGLALGIATSGSTFGQFALVPLFELISDKLSWRYGYGIAAIATATLAPISFVLLTMQHRREAAAATVEEEEEEVVVVASLWAKLRRLACSRLYWGLTFGFVVCGVTTTGFIEAHLVALAGYHGMSKAFGAFCFGLLSACNGAGMLLAGFFSDRYSRIAMLTSIYFVRGLCYLMLCFVETEPALLVFSALFGFVDYSVVPIVVSPPRCRFRSCSWAPRNIYFGKSYDKYVLGSGDIPGGRNRARRSSRSPVATVAPT